MTKRNALVFALSIAMVLSSFLMAFAGTETQKTAFADMPDNWSTAALNKAVDNDLLKGYEVGDKKLIRAENPLTRAEMAAVVNRAFGATVSSKLKGVTDVSSTAWFAEDMAKAVNMGTFALDTKMRPNDNITRQEAFAVLARAFKATSTDVNHKALDKFSDKANISAWALYDLCGMAEAGYIQGFNGKLQPKANITRAEFAVVMDNLVKQYIDKAGTATEVVAAGNVLVRSAGVTLKDVTVKGDLVIGDGVGEGDAILDNVKVEGRTVVRGGGVNSVIIKGDSNLGKVVLAKTTGEVRVAVEGNAKVEVIIIDDGSDDVIIKGNVGTLEIVGDNVKVTATDATIKEGIISGANVAFVVEKSSSIANVTVSASNTAISGQGEVKTVDVVAGGNNAAITTPNTVTKVASDVSGVIAGGKEVPAGATATNNATGTDATVTQPSTGGGGGGGVTPKLTVNITNGDISANIDVSDFEGKTLDNENLLTFVDKLIANKYYKENVSKINKSNYKVHIDLYKGVFAPLATATSDNMDEQLKAIASNIAANSTDKINDVVIPAREISVGIASGGGITYNHGTSVETLNSVTINACGMKNVVAYNSKPELISDEETFTDLYNEMSRKTISEIVKSGTETSIKVETTNRTIIFSISYK